MHMLHHRLKFLKEAKHYPEQLLKYLKIVTHLHLFNSNPLISQFKGQRDGILEDSGIPISGLMLNLLSRDLNKQYMIILRSSKIYTGSEEIT